MRGKALKRQAQEMVSNVISYFRNERDNRGALLPLECVCERTAAATGVNLNVVHHQINQKQMENGDDTQGLALGGDVDELTAGSKRVKMDPQMLALSGGGGMEEATKLAIRRSIYNLHYSRPNPTVAQILVEIRRSGVELSGGRPVLLKILKEIGYKLTKVGGRQYFQEQHSVTICRRQFLRSLRENMCATNPRVVVYVDETWINLEAEVPSLKLGEMIETSSEARQSSRKKIQANGTGFIVIHAGTEKGYVNGAVELVKRGHRTDDNDENMNSLFEAWVSKDLLPSLVPNSIVIMDNASYHCVQADRLPTISTPKSEMVSWLRKHNISCSPEMLQAELLHLVRRYKPAKSYRIDELLEKSGHLVLRLPDYHPDLNPVEIIWAQAKRYYEEHKCGGEFNASSAEVVWKEALATITPERWAEAVQTVRSVQEDYWVKDCAIDARNEVVDFPVYDDSSDDSDSEVGKEFVLGT